MEDQNVTQNMISVCKYYQTGYCRNANHCKQLHHKIICIKKSSETKVASTGIQKSASILKNITTADTEISVFILMQKSLPSWILVKRMILILKTNLTISEKKSRVWMSSNLKAQSRTGTLTPMKKIKIFYSLIFVILLQHQTTS